MGASLPVLPAQEEEYWQRLGLYSVSLGTVTMADRFQAERMAGRTPGHTQHDDQIRKTEVIF